MSDAWKKRLKTILVWLTGAVCGAGGAIGVKAPEQAIACAANQVLDPAQSQVPNIKNTVEGLFKK